MKLKAVEMVFYWVRKKAQLKVQLSDYETAVDSVQQRVKTKASASDSTTAHSKVQ